MFVDRRTENVVLLLRLDLVSDDASLANAFSDAEPDVDFGHDERVLSSLRRRHSHDVYKNPLF